MPDYRAMARQFAIAAGLNPDIFERQIQQESKFNPDAYNAKTGATGIAQIVPKWHPTVNPRDPVASLRYAANWVGSMVKSYDGSYPRALAAYNWGPGAVTQWDGRRESLPKETRDYLDVILGEDWKGERGGTGGGGGSWLPSIDPSAIGAGIVNGIGEGLATFWQGALAGGKDAVIDRVAPVGLALAGLWCLSAGLVLITLRSDAGSAAIRGAASTAGGAPGGAAAGAATGAARALP